VKETRKCGPRLPRRTAMAPCSSCATSTRAYGEARVLFWSSGCAAGVRLPRAQRGVRQTTTMCARFFSQWGSSPQERRPPMLGKPITGWAPSSSWRGRGIGFFAGGPPRLRDSNHLGEPGRSRAASRAAPGRDHRPTVCGAVFLRSSRAARSPWRISVRRASSICGDARTRMLKPRAAAARTLRKVGCPCERSAARRIVELKRQV